MIKLGCIADDFTGATDLSNNLAQAGMRVLQTIGVPGRPLAPDFAESYDAVVVALKSRTIPAAHAVEQSLQAQAWLTAQGAQQIYFKYCSTFDSSAAGNIGPVTEALMDALGCDFCVGTPAFPDNKRAVFRGYLFVGDVLLNESGMQNHPLTPMTDPNLVRVLQAQCQKGTVGLIEWAAVARGPDAITERIKTMKALGISHAIADAISNDDLIKLGAALKGHRLVAGGSGVAIGLPQNFGIRPSSTNALLPPKTGSAAIVSGSCSVATNGQVRHFLDHGGAAFAIRPERIAAGDNVTGEVLTWARRHLDQAGRNAGPLLVYSSADAGSVAAVQRTLGGADAGAMIESTLAGIARGLVAMGVGQLIVAGGETSGACVQALQLDQLKIGPQIAPGVPWCHADVPAELQTADRAGLHLALKSGNFGEPDFFSSAFKLLN